MVHPSHLHDVKEGSKTGFAQVDGTGRVNVVKPWGESIDRAAEHAQRGRRHRRLLPRGRSDKSLGHVLWPGPSGRCA